MSHYKNDYFDINSEDGKNLKNISNGIIGLMETPNTEDIDVNISNLNIQHIPYPTPNYYPQENSVPTPVQDTVYNNYTVVSQNPYTFANEQEQEGIAEFQISEKIFFDITDCQTFIIKSNEKISNNIKQSNLNKSTAKIKNTKKLTKILIANFIICQVDVISSISNSSNDKLYIIKCNSKQHGKFNIEIPEAILKSKKIKKHIENSIDFSAFSTSNNDKLINNLLYNHIKDNAQEVQLNYNKPGFHIENSKWKFVSNNLNIEYKSEAISNSNFEDKNFDKKTAKEILKLYSAYFDKYNLRLLTAIRLCALLEAPIKSLDYKFEKLISITGCNNNDKKNFLNNFLKIYNRDKYTNDIISLRSIKNIENEIKNKLCNNKGNLFIFDDDTISNHYQGSKSFDKINYLSKIFANSTSNQSIDCLCCVISDRYLSKCGSDVLLNYHINDIPQYSNKKIMEICYLFDQIVVDFVNIAFLKTHYQLLVTYPKLNELKYNNSKNTFKALASAMNFLSEMFSFYDMEYSMTKEEISDYIYKIIKDSELFYDSKNMINKLKSQLEYDIINNNLQIFNSDLIISEPQTNNKSIAYFKDNLLLLTPLFFKELVSKIPCYFFDKEGTVAKKQLYDNDFIIANNGEGKYDYKASPFKGATRKLFIAVCTNKLNTKTQALLPIKNQLTSQQININDGIERVQLGIANNEERIYWSIGKELSNKHVFIRGSSGSGKTYLILSLVKQLHSLKKRIILFDHSKVASFNKTELLKVYDEKYLDQNIVILTSPNICDIIEQTSKIIVVRNNIEFIESLIDQLIDYINNSHDNLETFIVLDELSNISINENSAISEVMLQGRKLNIFIIAASQMICSKSYKDKLKIFGQSSLKVAFNSDSKTATEITKEITTKNHDAMIENITSLKKGHAIFYGELEDFDGNISNTHTPNVLIKPD